MNPLSSFTSVNTINRRDFFRDLFLITFIITTVGGIIDIFMPELGGTVNVFLAIFQLKFYHILIVKRFHDFHKLGKSWANAYIMYVIIFNVFIISIMEYIGDWIMLNETMAIFGGILLVFTPLIIIGSIPGVPQSDIVQ